MISEDTPVNGLLQVTLVGRKRCPSANNMVFRVGSVSPANGPDESPDGSKTTPMVQGSKGGIYINLLPYLTFRFLQNAQEISLLP